MSVKATVALLQIGERHVIEWHKVRLQLNLSIIGFCATAISFSLLSDSDRSAVGIYGIIQGKLEGECGGMAEESGLSWRLTRH